MNSAQAKEIKLTRVMALLGYEVKVIERGSTEYKYLSPFRDESEPSFNVNIEKNAWFDFGLGKGGNTLDFAIEYNLYKLKGGSVISALHWLNELTGQGRGKQLESKPKISPKAREKKLKLLNVAPITSKIILSYLEDTRKISREPIVQYLLQVQYLNIQNHKTYFAFGIENLSGGYEIRVASDDYPFKSAIDGRDISLIQGDKPELKKLNVFEGTTDFLSLLTLMKTVTLVGDSILMHSVASYKRCIEYIKKHGYRTVNLFLDNDPSGRKTTQSFSNDLSKFCSVIDRSDLFLPYNDINESLKSNFIPKAFLR